ncbi:MAG: PH domain-containing protein [Euryarchaeota archaeon]|nr:PH domain-containing protein [Euryarchaeota archaeon]
MRREGNMSSPYPPPVRAPPGSKPGIFPRDFLGKDEVIYWEGQPSKVSFYMGVIGAFIFLILALIFAFFELVFIYSATQQFLYTCLVPIIIFSAIMIASILFAYFRWKNTSYAITSRRVVTTSGIFAKAIVDCNHDKIQNVTMIQGLAGKMFGYGSIVFATAGLGGGGMAGSAFSGGFGWGGPGVAVGLGNVMLIGVEDPIAVRKFSQEIIEYALKEKKKEDYMEMAAAMTVPKPNADQRPGQKFCSKCGAPNQAKAAFCSSCGGKIE